MIDRQKDKHSKTKTGKKTEKRKHLGMAYKRDSWKREEGQETLEQ